METFFNADLISDLAEFASTGLLAGLAAGLVVGMFCWAFKAITAMTGEGVN